MRFARLRGSSDWSCLVEIPETRRERRRGLLARSSLEEGYGMLFLRCRSVHTLRMRFPIAIALLDDDLRVLTAGRLAPGRVTFPRRGVRHVLETAEGTRPVAGERLRLELRGEGPDQGAREPRDERAQYS
jgi:uncharacterized membrane protein (UPF0127 family)